MLLGFCFGPIRAIRSPKVFENNAAELGALRLGQGVADFVVMMAGVHDEEATKRRLVNTIRQSGATRLEINYTDNAPAWNTLPRAPTVVAVAILAERGSIDGVGWNRLVKTEMGANRSNKRAVSIVALDTALAYCTSSRIL